MNLSRFASPSLFLLAPVLALALFGPSPVSSRVAAQAIPTAAKSLDIGVYGGYINSNSDYGPYRNTGEAFGIDFTQQFHFPIVPSLEARINLTNGPAVAERTYLPGIRGEYTLLHVLHPYAAAFVGPGTITFNFANHGYQGDSSVVYSMGGGLNLDVTRNFGVMADFQYQHWSLGQNDTLTPALLLFGVTYRIPFRPYNRRVLR
jgi:hypothetical protein